MSRLPLCSSFPLLILHRAGSRQHSVPRHLTCLSASCSAVACF
uniref:Uncharacterized protein n=1 Tax=Rhizophora mucronata TaxID=61149 RepID=A0A2P2NAV2_RHIMU